MLWTTVYIYVQLLLSAQQICAKLVKALIEIGRRKRGIADAAHWSLIHYLRATRAGQV